MTAPAHSDGASGERLAQFRAEWPVRITWAQVRAAEPTVFRQAAWGAILCVPAAALLVLWVALSFEFPIQVELPEWLDWTRGFLIVAIMWGGLLLGICAAVLITRPGELRRELAFRGFAAERGLQYARYGVQPPARGISFAEGTDGTARVNARNRSRGIPELDGSQSRFRANFALSRGGAGVEPDLQIAVAGYTGGKNDPRGPRAAFRYLQLSVPRQLPHLFIDSVRNGRLRQILPGTLRLKLEGDFDRHFVVYVPEGYERDALELLTPDVMASLIDYGREWDIEVVEDRLIAVSNRIRRRNDRTETCAMLLFAELVGSELVQQATHYSDPRAFRPRTQVAEAGQRLRRRSGWIATVILALAVAIMLGYPFVLGWILDS
ncbi:hypothetical protein EDF62_2823 [Leucobacter luti]|uniref:Uncharacterized protein n=1 Tax=Leucobacter luti TaxID=340320 RepID=A0A4R6RVB8_9MICO|nr:hypothetical protein [Leucobacter luti]TDP90255.1 hypothetical protein EDF62_2823 [Leucobacter luti]